MVFHNFAPVADIDVIGIVVSDVHLKALRAYRHERVFHLSAELGYGTEFSLASTRPTALPPARREEVEGETTTRLALINRPGLPAVDYHRLVVSLTEQSKPRQAWPARRPACLRI